MRTILWGAAATLLGGGDGGPRKQAPFRRNLTENSDERVKSEL